MYDLLIDFRYGCRLLWKNPAVTTVAALALALGIGANTAIFSAVHAVLLRPLPFPEPDRLVSIRIDHDKRNIHNALAPYPDIADWRRQCRSFEQLSAYSPGSANLITRDEPERASVWRVNASLLPTLGLNMAVGRAFTPEDDTPGAARVAILSHSLWERRFAADPAMVGRAVSIDGDPYLVVGVLATPELIRDLSDCIHFPCPCRRRDTRQATGRLAQEPRPRSRYRRLTAQDFRCLQPNARLASSVTHLLPEAPSSGVS